MRRVGVPASSWRGIIAHCADPYSRQSLHTVIFSTHYRHEARRYISAPDCTLRQSLTFHTAAIWPRAYGLFLGVAPLLVSH